MIYLLDTNAVIALFEGRPASVSDRIDLAPQQSLFTSSIVLFELWYGVARSSRLARNTLRLETFLDGDIGVLDFDRQDAAIAGSLRGTLAAAGTPIGPYDVLIAAQALRHKATLVTANVGEFARVPGLSWENWAAG